MEIDEKRIVKVGTRLSSYIGAKATRDKKLQAASMHVEFALRETLIMLCYLGRDPDKDISSRARKNLIPAARAWYARPDKPELPNPIHEIVMKVIEQVGPGEVLDEGTEETAAVQGQIGLFGLAELIQTIDHNHRTVRITLQRNGSSAVVFTDRGRVIGAVMGEEDGLEALYSSFAWTDAVFDYVHGYPGTFRNRIEANTLNLVMDALERMPPEEPLSEEAVSTWKVQGRLKTMNLLEIAEIFEMNSRKAICRLNREEGEQGTLFFANGRIVNAALGDLAGTEAAFRLLAWPDGQFVITATDEDSADVIHMGMQNLIIEAMRMLDEGLTLTDRTTSELVLINELFDGQDVVTLPVLDRVLLVFGEDERVRDALADDPNPVVRKACRVKISRTVYKYLNPATDMAMRHTAARGRVPLSTTEKLVLLSYLSHDESEEIREEAKKTLASLDLSTYRKGLRSDLHPLVLDFLVRETIRDESLISVVCSCEGLQEDTALYILERWKGKDVLRALIENTRLMDRSANVSEALSRVLGDDEPVLKTRVATFEQSVLDGDRDIKVEGPLWFCGLAGLMRAARHGARSGTVIVRGVTGEGRVFFSRGKIIGAQWGPFEGRPALEHILSARDLRFRYVLRTHFHVQNVDAAAAEELLESPAAQPFHDEEARTGVRLITGSLEAMDLYELLSSLEGTPIPLRVSVICEEGMGEIYRDRSRILGVHVQGKESAYKAMAALLTWNGIRFMVGQAVGEMPTTVDKTLGDFFTESVNEIPAEMKQVVRPGELPEWELSEAEYQSLYHQILQMGVADKIKLAYLGSQEARDILVRDANKLVAVATVRSPKMQEHEIETISKSRAVCEDVLRHIAATKEWMQSYTVKLNLAANSKTPIPIALKLLVHLRELDLRKMGKSKDVSSIVAAQARRLADTKGRRSY